MATNNYAEQRFELIPQMRVYDNIRQFFMPYVCQSNPVNFRTEAICTDQLGFRHSYYKDQLSDSNTWLSSRHKTLLLGGSVALSWGASSDRHTLSSALSDTLDSAVLTLGIMAANSLQEYIAAAPFYQDADFVISITGMNTLYACLSSKKPSFYKYGPFYPVNNVFYEAMRQYDFLTLCYLLTDNLNPNAYLKSLVQKKEFNKTLINRFVRRVIAHFSSRNLFDHKTEHLVVDQDMDGLLDFAIDMQTRDIANTANAAGSRKYLCVLQPFLPILDKTYTKEEELLKNLSTHLLHPEVYSMLYEILYNVWTKYIGRIHDFCNSRNISCLDLNNSNFQGWCFVDSCHLNDNGNKIVAQHIGNFLKTVP